MSAPVILQTKLTPPPVRADRIHRPRLTQQFGASLTYPLMLVCAPAGYGKSTLLAEWFDTEAGREIVVGWLSLDEDDSDPIRFLTYLVTAVANASGIDTNEIVSLLQSSQPPPPKVILTTLISRVEDFPRYLALVLDDYHRIDNPMVHDAINFLLDHVPSRLRLVITSREDPPFPLARFRGRGQLVEIRADDLRFTLDEVEQFLRQMLNVELNADQIKDLDTRTEGWIAGLQLAALAMKGRQDIDRFITAFTGSHRYILDYLSEEVLSRQTEATRIFLLQTSILDRLSGPLCDAVTGRTNGQSLLEQIERSNLFLIPLDDERYWYRYHHLFGDTLRRHLQQTHPDLMNELHCRASIWFEQNGWIGEAIEHALIGKDHDRAAGLIEQRFEHAFTVEGAQTFLRWIQKVPDGVLQAYPNLELNYAFTLTAMDAYDEAERYLLQVEQQLTQNDLAHDHNHRKLAGFAAIVRLTLKFYLEQDTDTVIAAGKLALALLPEEETQWRVWSMVVIACSLYAVKGQIMEAESWFEQAVQLIEKSANIRLLEPALHHQARMYVIQGQLQKAQAAAIRLLQHTDQIRYRGVAHLELCKVYYEQNHLDKAFHHANMGWEVVKGYALIRFVLDGYVIQARIKNLQGAEAEARALMQEAVQIVQESNLKQIFLPVLAWQAWLWLVQGDVAAAARWAENIEPGIYGDLNPALEFEHIILARIQITQGRLDDAQQLLARLLAAARDAGRTGRVISLYVLQALVARMQGSIERALDTLQSALALAEPEGYVRTFVDEGALMLELLRAAHGRDISAAYITKLVAAFDYKIPVSPSVLPERKPVDDFEPLSERELEVLRLIAEGASNREIGQALFISIGTVKKHSSNIFLKLDARSRTQAVVNARKYNIL